MYTGVAPVPDWAFVKELKQFDSKLDIVFDRMAERFIIRRDRGWGKPWGVLVIETMDGNFRQPDQRDIKKLWEGDLWKHGGVKEHIRRGEEKMLNHKEKQTKDAEDELRAVTRDNKIQLSNTFRKASNQGSKAPEFRRVEVKNSRALTAEQIRSARQRGVDPWSKAA